MTTERRTRLHRAPSLPAFRAALSALLPTSDLLRARATAVLVPTRSAAELLRRSLEDRLASGAALVLPDLLTRGEWYERLHQRAGRLPRLLTAVEREVLVEGAAHEAITEGDTPPFHLRPALIGEILDLYDGLRRNQRTVARFEEQLSSEFDSAVDYDRGAERLLRQTRFLARAFHAYERRVGELQELDEHTLREALLSAEPDRPYRAIVVAVGDVAHEPGGLWSADYALLTRLPGLQSIDLVATEEQLATGLLERLHDLLPGLDEVRVPQPAAAMDAPVLVVPRDDGTGPVAFRSRDREDELVDLVRRVRALVEPSEVPLDRVGVVVGRPLPYVYLAREVFASGGVPLESRDALPLAGEPFAAALDLVFSAMSTGFGAAPLAALLRSPHFAFGAHDDPLALEDVAALEVGASAFDFGGDADRLDSLATAWADGAVAPPRDPRWDRVRAARAAREAARVIRALAPVAVHGPASAALRRLLDFLDRHARPVAPVDPLAEREQRARSAVFTLLDGLARAFSRHHDPLWTVDELGACVRRWVESETFAAASGAGVLLVDRAAAPFGEFVDLHLAGLVDGEWPARARRNVFYSNALLAGLGWPRDPDRSAAGRAAFVDLLQSARSHVTLSEFALEDDALVEPSPLLHEAGRAGLSQVPLAFGPQTIFTHEALALRPVPPGAVSGTAASWAALRARRPDPSSAAFHGQARPPARRAWSVSAIDQYDRCPFKFFARYVLRLAEERPEEEGLTPLERGQLIHEVFERFYHQWQARGHRTVTADRLDAARSLAGEVLESCLAPLAPSDAALERTRFLGSPIAPGLIEVVLRMEAGRDEAVVERWMEHRLDGSVALRTEDGGVRTVDIRGIADRVDLLADGTFRVIDYKSSRAPGPLQLAIYATALRQRLADYRGRQWALGEAAYLAFREDPPARPLGRSAAEVERVLAEEEARFVTLVDGIARGEFPPRPKQRSFCTTCGWATVCRKDYVEADDPAPAV